MPNPYDIFRGLRERTDEVIVAVSRGKDSLALLDVACRTFRRVEAYCMVLVPGLSFVEDYLAYLERRYPPLTIDRVPHWWLSEAFRTGTFRPLTRTCPRIGIRDIQAAQRERTGVRWIISGEKRCDSLQRRGMLSASGTIDEKVSVAYPLADWSGRHVYQYLKHQAIPLPTDYRLFSRSFSCQLDGPTLSLMKDHYPDDYAKVLQTFPFAEAGVLRHRLGRDPADQRKRRVAAARKRPRKAPAAELPDEDGAA